MTMYETFFLKNNLHLIKKNESVSLVNRLKGNELLKTNSRLDPKLQMEILTRYNKSIAFARLNSQELALAYGNRSYLTFSLRKYEESIFDIDRALLIPETLLTFKAKLLIRKGQCQSAINDKKADEVFAQAEKIINQIQNLVEQEKLSKLLNLRKVLPKQIKITKFQFPQFSRSKEISCMNDAINLKFNEIYGRHLVANRDIKTGEFLMIEEAYAVVPEEEKIYILCSFCLCPAWTGVPCNSCVFAIYCSEECRQKSWTKYHDVECFIMTLIASRSLECLKKQQVTLHKLLYRMRFLIIASKEKGGKSMDLSYLLEEFKKSTNCKDKCLSGCDENGTFLNEKLAGCLSLSCSSNQNISSNMMLTDMYMEVLKYLYEVEIITPEHKQLIDQNITVFNNLLIQLSSIISNNSYRFDVFECNCGEQYGSGALYHKEFCISERGSIIGCASSLVNHSCLPNVDRLFECGKIILFASRPIKKDEQLFCCYGPKFQSMEKSERQAALKSRYNFDCKCEACEKTWPTRSSQDIQKSGTLMQYWISSVQKYKLGSDPSVFIKWKDQKNLMQNLRLTIDKLFLKHLPLTANTLLSAEDLVNILTLMYSQNYTTTFDLDE